MDCIKSMLKENYGIECVNYFKVEGGISATSYKVVANSENFFLKCYDKRNIATALWTSNIDVYMKSLIWFNDNTQLKGKITCPIVATNGDYKCENNIYIFILFEYIEGFAIEKQPLTQKQVEELAEIIAHLHEHGEDFPIKTESIKEDFSLPFCISLKNYFTNDFSTSTDEIKAILHPCREQIMLKIKEIELLSEKLKSSNQIMRLCHTDAHGFNLMQNDCLILIDWEGLKLAPVEADLFMWVKKDYWSIFLKSYLKIRPEYKLDDDLISFYTIRRKLEDIWAFIESILYDNLSKKQYISNLSFLSNECRDLEEFCF